MLMCLGLTSTLLLMTNLLGKFVNTDYTSVQHHLFKRYTNTVTICCDQIKIVLFGFLCYLVLQCVTEVSECSLPP